jgi:hypothetical protein
MAAILLVTKVNLNNTTILTHAPVSNPNFIKTLVTVDIDHETIVTDDPKEVQVELAGITDSIDISIDPLSPPSSDFTLTIVFNQTFPDLQIAEDQYAALSWL